MGMLYLVYFFFFDMLFLMGKRVILFSALLIIYSSAIFAEAFYLGLYLGYRDSTTTINSNVVNLVAGYENFSFDAQIQGNEEFSVSGIYDFKVGKTLHNELIVHSLYVPEEGRFSDFSYFFSQNIESKYIGLFYGLGLQVGLAYSQYSSLLSWSLSPLIKIGGKLKIDPVSLSFGYSLNSNIERSWKAIPIYFADLKVQFNENSSVILSGFMREAEYLMDNWHMITAWGISLGYVYRGNL